MNKIFLHICCSICAIHPVRTLQGRGVEVTGFWYNPNIHPAREYSSRLDSVHLFSPQLTGGLVVRDEYGLVDFVRAVAGREAERCRQCYTVRLYATAEAAAARGFSHFSTTLLISPYQNQELIKEKGEEAGEKFGVGFYFEDFRSGFREAQSLARGMGLYRQKYCGCIYSEMERFRKKQGV